MMKQNMADIVLVALESQEFLEVQEVELSKKELALETIAQADMQQAEEVLANIASTEKKESQREEQPDIERFSEMTKYNRSGLSKIDQEVEINSYF